MLSPNSKEIFTATDTRSRILAAAYRLLRKRGYHASGLADILELAQAPKGSMYHHFPGGKEEIGVAVVEIITNDLLAIFNAPAQISTAKLLLDAGEQLVEVSLRTNFEICAMFSSFVAESQSSPKLAQAVARAYTRMQAALEQRLLADGFAPQEAGNLSQLIVALLEGSSILSQAMRDVSALKLAFAQAAQMCKPNPQESSKTKSQPRVRAK